MHGTPGSRMLCPLHLQDASNRGIRLVGYSRPGYGGSTRQPGRRIVDGAADVEALADSLGIERFGVWGHSGGGSYALACAAALPKRVVAAVSLSTLAPYGAEGLDFFAGMGDFNVEDFRLMMKDRAEWEIKNREDAKVMALAPKEERRRLLQSLISNADSGAYEELDGFFQAQSAEGFKAGVDGIIDDSLADFEPWGFDPSSVRVPVQVWHGREDRFVPFSHGQWLAAHVARAEAHLEQNEGHVTLLVNRMPEVHAWIASKF